MSENAKNIGILTILLIALIAAVFWFSHEESGEGIVASKWVQNDPSTSCDENGQHCTTTDHYTYYVQMENNDIFTIWWGRLKWDPLLPGMKIRYNTRGYRTSFYGYRMSSPTIMDYEVIR